MNQSGNQFQLFSASMNRGLPGDRAQARITSAMALADSIGIAHLRPCRRPKVDGYARHPDKNTPLENQTMTIDEAMHSAMRMGFLVALVLNSFAVGTTPCRFRRSKQNSAKHQPPTIRSRILTQKRNGQRYRIVLMYPSVKTIVLHPFTS
jgi:hypothetical protein